MLIIEDQFGDRGLVHLHLLHLALPAEWIRHDVDGARQVRVGNTGKECLVAVHEAHLSILVASLVPGARLGAEQAADGAVS